MKLKTNELAGYNTEHCSREKGVRGGAGFYISKSMQYTVRRDLSISESESLWIETNLGSEKKNTLIGVIYSSPVQRNLPKFTESFEETLEKISLEGKNAIIMGDMNIDLYKIKATDSYAQGLISSGFLNLISFPTRRTEKSATLIDHILTNVSDLTGPITSGVLINDISDHYMTFATFPINFTKTTQTENRTILSFKKYDKDKVIDEARKIDWEFIIQEESPENAYNLFCNKIKEIQNKYIIKKPVNPKEDLIQPWMTKGIRRAQKHRYKLYKHSQQNSNNNYLRTKYVTYKNKLCFIMRKAEQDYYREVIEGAQGNQAKIWHIINDIIGKKKRPSAIPRTLKNSDEIILEDQQDICNEMNEFFANVGPSLSFQIPQSRTDPLAYVRAPNSHYAFFLTPILVNETLTKLQNIKPNKAHGPDWIHPRFIRDIAMSIAKPLTHIINLGLTTGKIPQALKIAKIIPSHKSGDKRKATNYRPISILPVFAKIYESLIYDRLNNYLDKKGILIPEQYGFQKNKNTSTALLSFVENLQKSLDSNQHTLAVFIDLKKAFDTVNPEILLRKLFKYGIRGTPLEWFKDYFQNRKQFIETHDVQSSLQTIRCGVPQGSNLGPLLFLIYINDLPYCLRHSKAILFADDTTIHITGPKTNDISIELNQDLQSLDQWLSANQLSLNVNKTLACYFKPKKSTAVGQLEIRSNKIPFMNSVKYLGIHIDNELSWKNHISFLTNKVNKSIGLVCKIRRLLNRQSLLNIYYSLVHSNIIYCLEIWGTAFNTTLLPLTVAQIRIMD